MPLGERRRLVGLVEPLARVQPDRLEEAVAARARGAVVGCHEGLLDETREHVGNPPRVEIGAGAHALDRVELEAAGERRKPAKQRPLVRLEEVVAPLKRGRERVLPCRRRVTRGAEHAKAVVEALRDRRGTKCPQAPGGELERERQAVEAEADPRDVHGVLLVEREARRSRLRPLDEEPHGLVVEEPARLECLLGVGDVERRNPEHDLARHTQRPAARRQDRQLSRGAEEAVREPGSRCEHVLASSTRAAPSGYDGSMARASSSASRVLPAPPVPARVSSRVPRRSGFSSASSRPRPMNELASAGSEAGRSAPAEPRPARASVSSVASSASSSRRAAAQSS